MNRLEAAQPLACRCVILNAYLLLVGWFGHMAGELSDELGPLDPAGADKTLFGLIRHNHERLCSIYEGKMRMHDALQGKPEDTKLLKRLRGYIECLRRKVIEPLSRLPRKRPAEIAKIRRIGKAIKAICASAGKDLKMAQRRFADALLISSEPDTGSYAVVSLDMVEYSKYALYHETQDGVDGLFRLTSKIRERIQQAMRDAGIEPNSVPIYDSGDGALLYIRDGAVAAVAFARAFQKEVNRRNLSTAKVGKARQFRVGIATGDVCMQFLHTPVGSTWGFCAAGVAIINAVRIQAQCKKGCVLVDAETYSQLSATDKRAFKQAPSVKPKKHEKRTIKVYAWTP